MAKQLCTAPSAESSQRVPCYRYNTIMKLIFLGSSFSIIYYMRFHRVVKNTYDKEQDTFRVLFLVVPCAVLALVLNQDFSPLEVRPSMLVRHLLPKSRAVQRCPLQDTSGN